MLSHFRRVRLFATPWTVARQAPLSMGFASQKYRVGCQASSRWSSRSRDWTNFSCFSCIDRRFLDCVRHLGNQLQHVESNSQSESVKVKVAQLCLTLCDPMDHTVHGFLQARILEWVSFPFSRVSSQPMDWTQVPCVCRGILYQLSHKGSPNQRTNLRPCTGREASSPLDQEGSLIKLPFSWCSIPLCTLAIFQSFDKVGSDSFCFYSLFLQGGTRAWSCLLYHFANITQLLFLKFTTSALCTMLHSSFFHLSWFTTYIMIYIILRNKITGGNYFYVIFLYLYSLLR